MLATTLLAAWLFVTALVVTRILIGVTGRLALLWLALSLANILMGVLEVY